MNPRLRGSIFILISAVSFGFMPIFARLTYESGRVGVQELLFVRFILAFLLMGVFLRVTHRLSRPSKHQLLILLALGGIGYFLQSTFYFTALLSIPVSVAALVLNVYPAFVTAGSLALGWEKFSVSIILALILALSGLALVANPMFEVAIVGIVMALGAAIIYTVYILVSSRVLNARARLQGDVATFYVFGGACLSFGLSSVLTGDLQLSWTFEAWIWVVLISCVCTFLAVTTFFQGLKLVGPSRTAILSVGELVTSVLVASIIFTELLTVTQLVGGLLILIAMVLAGFS